MSDGTNEPAAPPRALLIAAFAAVYLIWGSTYLAIRFAIETMPPFLMGSARFLLAGGILYAGLRWRGVQTPTSGDWTNAAVVGALLLGLGNGGVNWAEQKVPSSVVALIIAVTPAWFALLDWVHPGGKRPNLRAIIGILIGFVGMLFLVGPQAASRELDPVRVGGVICASVAWASGSIYARYSAKPATPLMGVALQMVAGGALLAVFGVATGEAELFSVSRVSVRSALAFSYLIVAGSWVGFTAYSWLLKVSTPARVSTYAYVNPVIAVLLGCLWGGERLSVRALWGAAIIILGVVLISIQGFPRLRRS